MEYYITNFAVILVIAALASVFAVFNIEPLYTWLFFPFKIFNIYYGIHKVISTLAVSAIFAFVTAIVPVFVKPARHMHKKKEDMEEKHDEKETQPI